ncbi:MAG TPA: CHASE4 domain-containing protein [Candidatus Hydrogenedentes bacterium]|nr:CHASE4 domain-containing protein [Candidatus Hydrogenedentota bacterium]HOL75949.1 CHASE4 domain-containing protein [Candidatus Hydrogenedentota bacterium]HPO85642.1 CHASE4 domain-containing protein [Candidatus Hydrogenedentota bacterium]
MFHSLKGRIVLFLIIVVLLYIFAEYTVQRVAVLKKFEELERDLAFRDLSRCVKAIERECEHLKMFTNDWSLWNDTYEFVETIDPRYIASNLYWEVYVQNRLNFISIRDTKGNPVWENGYKLDRREPEEIGVSIPSQIFDYVLTHAASGGPEAARAGLIQTTVGPMLVAICPILRSDGSGPVRGTFVMGRLYTQEVQDLLREQVDLDFVCEPLPEGADIEKLASGHVERESAGHLLLATVLDDLAGNPLMVLRLNFPRYVWLEGRKSARVAYVLTVGAGLATLLVLMISLQRVVVKPILALTGYTREVKLGERGTPPVLANRKDEIGQLAKAFDDMLQRLEHDFELRRRAENALQENEARLQTIIETAPDGIMVLDETGTILQSNLAGESILAAQRGGLSGLEFRTFLADEESTKKWDDVHLSLQTVSMGSMPHSVELQGRRLDGTVFPMDVNIGVFSFGSKKYCTIVIRDTTDFKAMQERATRSERLAAIGEMSAAITHELRNPLTGINGFLQLLQLEVGNDPKRGVMLKEALSQVARMENTVRRLLMFARPWKPEKKVCDLASVIELAQADMEDRSEMQNVIFVNSRTDGVNTMAWVDAQLLRQVFVNLFENAGHAMNGKGTIHTVIDGTSSHLTVMVIDTGPGLAEGAAEKVFEPFYTSKTKGTGLGLAICRQIVEAHGGTIRLANASGGGAIAVVEIPRGEDNP